MAEPTRCCYPNSGQTTTPIRPCTPTRTMPEEPEAGRNMSDGDNATPGLPSLPGPPGPRGDNPWLTRNPRPSPIAAPWERSGYPEPEGAEKARPQTGNHTDRVTVADLIAKLHGDKRGPEPDVEPPAPATEIIAAVSDDTDVIPVVSVQPSELPDLALVHRPGPVPRAETAGDTAKPKPRRRRSRTVLAGRAAA